MSKKKKRGPTKRREDTNAQFQPVTNPKLKEAIANLKQGNSVEAQQKLNEELKKAKLLSPCDIEGVATGGKLKANQVKMYLLNTNDGKTFFPAFTDLEEASTMSFGEKEAKNIVRTIKDFDVLFQQKDNTVEGIVINPKTDNLVIPRNLIGVLAGRLKMPSQAQTSRPSQQLTPQVPKYEEPAVYPTQMVNAIYDCCAEIPEISRVWLKLKVVGPDRSYYLPVEAERKDTALLDKIREVAEPLAKEVPIEVVFYNETIEKDAIQGAFALYDKELEL